MTKQQNRRCDREMVSAIAHAQPIDIFAVLGPHAVGNDLDIRVMMPSAERMEVLDPDGNSLGELDKTDASGFFEGMLAERPPWLSYRLRAHRGQDHWDFDDPYRFGSALGALDNHLLREGTHNQLWEKLGAHLAEHQGLHGCHFAVWAPSAKRVAVVGDFNGWDHRVHAMRFHPASGVWEIFIPGVHEGAAYKFEITDQQGERLPLKADPVGFAAEMRPASASIVRHIDQFAWSDDPWIGKRQSLHQTSSPISILEVHLGSWQRGEDNRFLTYDELAERLVAYVKETGFTHIELLPINEHPLDGSWGYQPVGLFAPTSRHGDPAAFARFVDRCHAADIGVLIDWVPGHFPTDQQGLARFDGTCLYEHEDPRQGFHQDWNTLIYNYGRREVANYLRANALFWLDRYHLDGLRVDAVASMLYLDYSREDGQWIPNRHGGNENLDAVEFLKSMNSAAYQSQPGIMTIAEESTTWPAVSRPVWLGGLGFGFKWNMGWMNDTLSYMSLDPVHRRWHHQKLTFGILYGFSENFVLPLSHDEVVHGKGTILGRMPGNAEEKFANLRAYYAFMWGHPGKKLLFMGQEFAQGAEWNFERGLDWHLLGIDWHRGVQRLVTDLNRLYRNEPALHLLDCEAAGFEWIEPNDAENSVFAWIRKSGDPEQDILVIANFTPMQRESYRIGVPHEGRWAEILNTAASIYRGSGSGNLGAVEAESISWHGRAFSVNLTLPPLTTLWLKRDQNQ